MISLILAAGYATRMAPLTDHIPKPLLPIGETTILTRLIRDLDGIAAIKRHVIVSNHKFIDQFRAWGESLRLEKPLDILDDGSTANDNRLGAVRDVLFGIESLGLNDDLLVAAGDNVLNFSLAQFVEFFECKTASAVMCYRESDPLALRRCGVIVPDEDFRIVSMIEKPKDPKSEWAVPPFYVYARGDLEMVRLGVESGCATDAPGSFIAWLCAQRPVYAMPMPGKRFDVGDLKGYERLKTMMEQDEIS